MQIEMIWYSTRVVPDPLGQTFITQHSPPIFLRHMTSLASKFTESLVFIIVYFVLRLMKRSLRFWPRTRRQIVLTSTSEFSICSFLKCCFSVRRGIFSHLFVYLFVLAFLVYFFGESA